MNIREHNDGESVSVEADVTWWFRIVGEGSVELQHVETDENDLPGEIVNVAPRVEQGLEEAGYTVIA